MKNFLYILITGLAIGALITFLLMRSCTPSPPSPLSSVTDTVYLPGDTKKTVDTIPKPYPVAVLVPEYLPAVIDTPAIIAHYYTINIYDQVLKDDSSAYIRLIDTLNKNQLQGRYIEFWNRRQTAIKIIEHKEYAKPPDFRLYGGGGLSFNDSVAGLSLMALAAYKQNSYYYSYNLATGTHSAGVLLQLFPNSNNTANNYENSNNNKRKRKVSFMPF